MPTVIPVIFPIQSKEVMKCCLLVCHCISIIAENLDAVSHNLERFALVREQLIRIHTVSQNLVDFAFRSRAKVFASFVEIPVTLK